ncbi:MAG TPA: 50S ribosomal protein L11 methyltransferase [Rhizomicrobium sp.]
MTDPADFIRANTTPATPPLVPRITLQLAKAMALLRQKLEQEAGGNDVHPPYWACAWPGGQALARYLLDHPGIVAGKSVLDFGSGCGVTAIAAALAGARDVLAADLDPFAVAAIRINAAVNGVKVEVTGEDIIGQDGGWQIILVGDMFYEPVLTERLLAWLAACTKRGACVLAGDAGRNCLPGSGLEKLATYSVTTRRELEEADFVVSSVYRLLG